VDGTRPGTSARNGCSSRSACSGCAFLIAAHQSTAAIRADRALERGDHSEARRQLLRWSVGYWLILALLVVAVWDMVMKPGL